MPSLGASGAIAGVLGAYILRFPKARILTLVPIGFFLTTFRIPAIFFLRFWFLQQSLYGIASLQVRSNVGMESGGIAYWDHAGDSSWVPSLPLCWAYLQQKLIDLK